jgi:hypothetical protein
MSTAPEHPTRRASRRWERIFVVLSVCLPIPLCAATGLSIPLPGPVERLAAALVPWADAATLDGNEALTGGENGSIVYAAGDRASDPQNEPEEAAGTSADRQPGAGNGTETEKEDGGATEDPAVTDPGGEEPSDDPDLLDDTVNEVEKTTDPVVDQIDGTVSDVGETVGDVVSGLGE